MQPYLKQVVARKSELGLYERVLENRALYQALPSEERQAIEKGYNAALLRAKPGFFLSFSGADPFALAWVSFALAISLLALFRIEGATLAAWILPLTVVCYGYFLSRASHSHSTGFFPSEKYVVENYGEGQGSLLRSREHLMASWHRYLIREWAQETIQADPEAFEAQLGRGLYAFNIGRLKWITSGKGDEVVTAGFTAPPSIFRLAFYFIWNVIFAWQLNRQERLGLQSNPS